jgi:hypothetical protein
MQSNEQLYRDQVQQDDYFDADLADAHRRIHDQAAQGTPATESPSSAAGELAERFMQTLQQTEASGDVNSLVALFADDADLSNLAMTEPLHGRDSIRQFWLYYLSAHPVSLYPCERRKWNEHTGVDFRRRFVIR